MIKGKEQRGQRSLGWCLAGSLWVAVAWSGPVHATAAQEQTAVERFPVRVTAVIAGGQVEIDRGRDVRIEVGDRVVFQTKSGQRYSGRVEQVGDRQSLVRPTDPQAVLPLATRGDVWVPAERFESEAEPEQPVVVDPEVVPVPPEHPPWKRLEEEWSEQDPLLARIRPLRPEERVSRQGGRVYGIWEPRFFSDTGQSEWYHRIGGEYWQENPFGRGGTLRIDGEWQRWQFDRPFADDVGDTGLRLDRASYVWGGTRYERRRYEVGRFLMPGMPELGLVDGVAASERLDNGHSFGGAIGGFPEPDGDLESGHDLTVAAFYRWVADASERWTGVVAFQKTWHDGSQDRDVLVGRMDWMPLEGWQLHGHLWVDLYESGDVGKSSGPEVTVAYLTASRDWNDQWGLHAVASYRRFPLVLRDEYQPTAPDTVLRDHNQRVSLGAWQRLDEQHKLSARLGIWDDEDDDGGDVEVAVDRTNLWGANSRGQLALFHNRAEFTDLYGMRAVYGRFGGGTHWDVLYEFSQNHERGLPSDLDAYYQHRLRATYGWQKAADWSFSIIGEQVFTDDDAALFLGFQYDRSF